MKRLTMSVALVCVLASTILAGDMPTDGKSAPPPPPPAATTTSSTTTSTVLLSLVLTIISLR